MIFYESAKQIFNPPHVIRLASYKLLVFLATKDDLLCVLFGLLLLCIEDSGT